MDSVNSWRNWSKSTANFSLPSSPRVSVTQFGNISRMRATLSLVRFGECIFSFSMFFSSGRQYSATQLFKFYFQSPQAGVNFHLAVELFFFRKFVGRLFDLALLHRHLFDTGNQIEEIFVLAR